MIAAAAVTILGLMSSSNKQAGAKRQADQQPHSDEDKKADALSTGPRLVVGHR